MDLNDIAQWDTAALEQVEQLLARRLSTIEGVRERLTDIGRLPGWKGESAEAARRQFQVTADDLTDEASAIGAVKQAAGETLGAVAHLKKELNGVRESAAGGGMTVEDNGEIADLPGLSVEDESAAEHERLRSELRAAARALILQAEDVDADAAGVLRKAASGEIDAGGSADVDSERQGHLSAPAPPQNSSPLDNREYWEAIPEQQRREVIGQHPEWVGNRDGIPAGVRHEANLNQFDDERTRLEAERDRLRADLDDNMFGGAFADEDAELWYVEQKLKDLDDLEKLVSDYPDGKLMLLDLKSGERGMAAFALGDPDTADHVSVTTPGINTTISSLGGMTDEGKALKAEAEKQLDKVGRGNETVATIAWLGYQPPTTSGPGNYDLPFTEQNLGRGWLIDSWQSDRATAGAPKLASFYEGIDAASVKPDPHITALGHSYGSYTQALALQDPGPGQPVNHAVFYGSPGINANDEPDLGLEQGHGFVMRAPDDPITAADGFGRLGPDPVQTKLEQLSVREATTSDGVIREDANGHSEYPRPSRNGELRTSGYNMAVIVAGLPELAVR
ncbi:alpha/beta hydrolase [Rhodococcus marinonascens]|uniref:alpha/beta hydrolase n=1 Tax=Rhodococcus marinonascens TaxID=38311 RepID=UPI000932B674|nr:alpha/beta hydrolase [Rhodococcus marinonascens]